MPSQLLTAIPTNKLIGIPRDSVIRFFTILAKAEGAADSRERTSNTLQQKEPSPNILYLSLQVTKYCLKSNIGAYVTKSLYNNNCNTYSVTLIKNNIVSSV